MLAPKCTNNLHFWLFFTEFANCYSSITKGMKKIPGGMWGKRSAGRHFPSLILPSSHPLSNFFPVRTAPEVLPNMATPAGFLCSLSCFLPLPTFPSSLHTSSPGEAGHVQMTPEAAQDSEVWWHSRKDTQLPEPVFAVLEARPPLLP